MCRPPHHHYLWLVGLFAPIVLGLQSGLRCLVVPSNDIHLRQIPCVHLWWHSHPGHLGSAPQSDLIVPSSMRSTSLPSGPLLMSLMHSLFHFLICLQLPDPLSPVTQIVTSLEDHCTSLLAAVCFVRFLCPIQSTCKVRFTFLSIMPCL